MKLGFIRSNFGQHRDISPFKEMVDNSRVVVVALHSKYKNELAIEPSVFNLVKGDVGELRKVHLRRLLSSVP
jgi:SpoU rRNA methylase family enzyme